jgi:hypothetical protein
MFAPRWIRPRLHCLLIAVAGILVLAACGESGQRPEQTSPPTVSNTEPSGNGSILGQVLSAVEGQDTDRLASLLVFAPEPCVSEPQGPGGSPVCPESAAPGDLVEVMPLVSCEGFLARPDEVDLVAMNFQSAVLFDVFDAVPNIPDPDSADHVVIISRPSPSDPSRILGAALYVDSNGITRIYSGCAYGPEDLAEALGLPIQD